MALGGSTRREAPRDRQIYLSSLIYTLKIIVPCANCYGEHIFIMLVTDFILHIFSEHTLMLEQKNVQKKKRQLQYRAPRDYWKCDDNL